MATVHPHKGYLNTKFDFYAKGIEEISYSIFLVGKEVAKPILKGLFSSNVPCSIKLNAPGTYRIEFNDGTLSEVTVEDGYKFGGSEYKKSYIFDEIPWCFVIMMDRTYFYNRETGESYVEPISPDNVEELSSDYVIFENSDHSERTIYSLIDQTPILNISNIIFYSKDAILWKDDDYVVVYSLKDRKIVSRIKSIQYLIDKENNRLLYAESSALYALKFSSGYTIDKIYTWKGEFKGFVDGKISVYTSFDKEKQCLHIVNHLSGELLKKHTIKGVVSSVNGFSTIDIENCTTLIREFDLLPAGIPEAYLEAVYIDYIFYSCDWDIYYVEKISVIRKQLSNFNKKEEIILQSLNTDLHQPFKRFDNKCLITDNRFILYNYSESFVCGKNSNGAGYRDKGHVQIHGDLVILGDENSISTLSRDGYWNAKIHGNFNFQDFEKYGVVYNKNTKSHVYLPLNIKSIFRRVGYAPYYLVDHMELGDVLILDGGKVYRHKSDCPIDLRTVSAVTPKMRLGISVDKNIGKVFLLSFDSGQEVRTEILNNKFDSSKYHQVLMDESGSKILYRNSLKTEVKDILTNDVVIFDNMSYIQQSNGIRPTFKQPSSLQPRIINPVTGQTLDCELMKTIKFISPDGRYYAGTDREMYNEYYNKDSGTVIDDKDFRKLLRSFEYPSEEKKGSPEWFAVTYRRMSFISRNLDFIKKEYPHLAELYANEQQWAEFVIGKDNKIDARSFIKRFIGVRGIAIIKMLANNSVIAKIDLGDPLTYINYVSFSLDSRYVSLAGYRDATHGLFLIYDLCEQKLLCRMNTGRAVWTTAFSSTNVIAAYTSDPNTIFFEKGYDEVGYECDSKEDFNKHLIHSRNFLTFSPDGSLMALSDQGYISKYDKYGNEQSDWGHQPSTFVEIRALSNIHDSIIVFHDLSNCGIEDTCKPKSVSSVSFSNDNKRLMMVGNDGVVIIRNLHIENKTCK